MVDSINYLFTYFLFLINFVVDPLLIGDGSATELIISFLFILLINYFADASLVSDGMTSDGLTTDPVIAYPLLIRH